jgi:hypothetical protein
LLCLVSEQITKDGWSLGLFFLICFDVGVDHLALLCLHLDSFVFGKIYQLSFNDFHECLVFLLTFDYLFQTFENNELGLIFICTHLESFLEVQVRLFSISDAALL